MGMTIVGNPYGQFDPQRQMTLEERIRAAREKELGDLEKQAAQYQRSNENFRLYGSIEKPGADNERMAAAVSGVPLGTLDRERTFASEGICPYRVEISDEGRLRQMLESAQARYAQPTEPILYEPVTQLQTAHYLWTEEGGIVETMTVEEEMAAQRAGAEQAVRDGLAASITKVIGRILRPYDTYEEAQAALYQKPMTSSWMKVGEDAAVVEEIGMGDDLPGLFGVLANHLNNYLEVFGTDDNYFAKLDNALARLDDGMNPLVQEMRHLVQKAGKGSSIAVGSAEFEEEVNRAIAEFWDLRGDEADEGPVRKEKDEKTEEKKGLSYQDRELLAAEQTMQLMDRLLGEERDERTERTLDAILGRRAAEAPDHTLRDRLRQMERDIAAEEAEQAAQTSLPQEAAAKTRTSEEERAAARALVKAWSAISEEFGWGEVEILAEEE